MRRCFQLGNIRWKHPGNLVVSPVKRQFFLLRCGVYPSKYTKAYEMIRYNLPLLQKPSVAEATWVSKCTSLFCSKVVTIAFGFRISTVKREACRWRRWPTWRYKPCFPGRQKGACWECFWGARSWCWWGWTEVTALLWQSDSSASKISRSSFSTIKKKKN